MNKQWDALLQEAIVAFLDIPGNIGSGVPHTARTPERVRKAYESMIAGTKKDPKDSLGLLFPAGKCDQMVHRSAIRVVSTCGHHFLPFIGKAHFSYLPKDNLVGISKIPRLIDVFARRLQVQEELTNQIVDAFQEIVDPYGCALQIRAYHFCEIVRGVEEHAALTTTTALRGSFKEGEPRAEFFNSIDKTEIVFP